jgi:thiamine pyrophosphate-dependent acetolactate synthase large subunit-like protein
VSRKVADVLCEMLANAGVKRCYGIVGDALNPFIDALRRNSRIDFCHVRHEEYGVFAAVAEAYLTGNPVAVCGTTGPGVVHLFNGLMDARKEGAPIIAIAGDVETSILDTFTLEELNPYKFFDTASLYTVRVVNPEQARSVFNTAILTAVLEKELAEKHAGALQACKRLMREPVRSQLEKAARLENEEYAARLRSPDTKEAITALFEKRPPDFTRTKQTVTVG